MEDEYTHFLRLYILLHETFCRMEGEHTLFTFIYLRFCIFLPWKMNTHYLRLYILGYEHFCCVEDEYTYYLRLYILGHDPFCCGR